MEDSMCHGTFDEVIEHFDPEIQAIARALRTTIASVHDRPVEIAWPRQRIASYGIGPKKMSEHYAYIAPQVAYVNLGFYHGVVLTDTGGLMEGAGKRLRHIKIRSQADSARKEIRSLLEAAVADRKNAAGKG
jgi:hypothetical protein